MTAYRLTINEKQADLIVRALEFYERVGGLGQLEVVTEPWIFRCGADKLEDARRALAQAKSYLTGFGHGASYGIYSPEVPDEHRVAYDLQQVIRHRLAWDRTPLGGMGVWFDEPHQTSQVALAEIEQIGAPAPGRLARSELKAIRARVTRYGREQLGQAATDRADLLAELDAMQAERDQLKKTLADVAERMDEKRSRAAVANDRATMSDYLFRDEEVVQIFDTLNCT